MIAYDSNSDRALFRRISVGDERAFKEYFDLRKVDLFRIIIRLTKSQTITEEIIQEIFIGLWVSRAHLAKVEDPASYLYRILLNKTTDYLKKEINQERIISAAKQQYKPPADNTTEHAIEARESLRWIEKAMDQLPPQQKVVYKLSRQQGLSNAEIAGQLHISPHTVRSHLTKAIGFIRTYLKDITIIFVIIANFVNSN
jgi:RNA polymerase sigma-70 factor (ECF subfamily)